MDACLPSSLRLDWIRYLSMLDKVFDIAFSSNTISMNKVVKKTEIISDVSEPNRNTIFASMSSFYLFCMQVLL